jgi:hypothetical protein
VADDWSPEEVAATVADYFVMLGHQLRQEPYNKREHNRRLQLLLNHRSAGAIEFKHANISAVLIESGFPYIDGYKPRANYQELLRTEVLTRLDHDTGLANAAQAVVDNPPPEPQIFRPIEEIFVPPPLHGPAPGVYERKAAPPPSTRRINYLEREARNSAVGLAGERFVLEVEHRRLWEQGHRRLAGRIEHVAQTQGDGLGYDILSFEDDGRERLIEVKSTTFGSMTPFFTSAREVAVSASREESYQLYRVFKLRDGPQIFALRGSIRQTCLLEATEYRASLSYA